MRRRIWGNLTNIKFKAIYTNECSGLASRVGSVYSFILAFTSASSVATWVIWEKYPVIWASIVGVSQVLHVLKPYIRFIKHEKDFLEMSFEFEWLYLSYEKLWYDYENQRKNQDEIAQQLNECRQKELSIEEKHKQVRLPHWKWLTKKSQVKVNTVLNVHFNLGG